MLSGDIPPNPLEKPGYRLDRHDEFDGTALDTTLWLPAYLPHWSSRERTRPKYRLAESCLHLDILRDQPPWSPEFDGEVRCSSIQTGHYSGPLGSREGQLRFSDALVVREAQENVRLYTPQYGYFEFRAKGITTSANHAALWMIGYEETPEQSGEICLCELLGATRTATASAVRYGIHPWADPTLREEFYEDTLPIDTARFHIYAVEWTPTHVDIFVDNVKRRTLAQSPAYPMQFMLSVYEHPFAGAWSCKYDPAAPYPKTFSIDYFRAYQPIGGY